jgi:adenylate cyclase
MASVPVRQGAPSGTAAAAQPSPTASRSDRPIRGIALRSTVIAASLVAGLVATLGLWVASYFFGAWLGGAWLDEYPSLPPKRTAAVASAPKRVAPSPRRTVAAAKASSPSAIRSVEYGRSGKPSPSASFLVLPFANQSNDPSRDYLADAITTGLISRLSRISGSSVIARDTAFGYKGKAVDVSQVGHALGVRYILAGGIERTGEHVRLTARLVDDETGKPVWADRLETSRSDLGEAQDGIVSRLAQTLNLHFAAPAEPARTADADARDLIMQGWAWCHRPYSAAAWQEARRAFERALKRDPQSIDARIGLAMVLGGRLADDWSGSLQQDPARAERLLREALARDPQRPMAHFALGVVRQMQNRLNEARAEYQTAIALDRNHARAYFHLGETLMYLGRPKAAIPDFEKAMRLSPRDPDMAGFYWAMGTAHLLSGRADTAIVWFERARAANPRLWFPHLYLAGAFALRGDVQSAKAELARSLELKPEINSLARMRFYNPWITTPQHWALQNATLNVGLRRAGLNDGADVQAPL